jgi:hypothetical protein
LAEAVEGALVEDLLKALVVNVFVPIVDTENLIN